MQRKSVLHNILIMFSLLVVCFMLCLFVHRILQNESLIAAIFVLGTFSISMLTDGYLYGILSALMGVLAVNFAFTFPYFKVNFTITENFVSAVIMVIVAVITSAITTKLKKQEYLKTENEKERVRTNLLRAVSHDLRTPLTTIYGSSSALLENPNDFSRAQQLDMLKGIKEDAEWLTRMVENLLSITKLDGGNVKIIKIPTVIDELIDSVLIKFNIRYPNHEVLIDLPDDFVTVPMDPLLIEQVLINLLENAVKHAVDMTELSIRVFTISGKAIFEVRDNGKRPFDDEIQPGIGLSVCNTIIKAHGGELRAVNSKAGGLLMRFTLDLGEDSYE